MLKNQDVLYPELSYKLVGILFEVHNNLGPFRSEGQYCDVIECLLKTGGFKYKREVILPVSFRGEKPGRNRSDFLIEDKIILEIKAKKRLLEEDFIQVKRYLAASGLKLGILVNLRNKKLVPYRILNLKQKLMSQNFKVNS